jgi:hypothetical protein
LGKNDGVGQLNHQLANHQSDEKLWKTMKRQAESSDFYEIPPLQHQKCGFRQL